MIKRSLYREAAVEIRRFQKQYPENNEQASRDWNRTHWWFWARQRWLEHIKGEVFWIELGEEDFGLVNNGLDCNKELLACILDRLDAGEENLDIINWAVESEWHIDEVCQILEMLDLNSRRDEMKSVKL